MNKWKTWNEARAKMEECESFALNWNFFAHTLNFFSGPINTTKAEKQTLFLRIFTEKLWFLQKSNLWKATLFRTGQTIWNITTATTAAEPSTIKSKGIVSTCEIGYSTNELKRCYQAWIMLYIYDVSFVYSPYVIYLQSKLKWYACLGYVYMRGARCAENKHGFGFYTNHIKLRTALSFGLLFIITARSHLFISLMRNG